MKTNLCRMLRSCLALLLICSMIVVQIPATALATKSQDVNDDGVINYVALGASNTNGYGLNGYMPSGVHEDPLAAPKGALNVYGYKQAPESAYPAQVKNMIDLFNDGLLDGDVTLNQLAISSMRVEEALYLLGDEYDYVNDDYMQWRFTGGQNWFAIAEPGGVSALRTAYQNALSTADVISIDLGWNNFGVYAFNNIKTILAGYDPDEDGELDFWKEPDFDAVLTDEEKVKYDEIKAKVMEMLSENIEGDKLKNKLDLMADALAYATLGAIVHFDSLVEWIYENNADAKIVVVNIQNLADDLVVEFEGETLELGDMYGELIDMVNLYRADKSPYADKYSFANAGDVETFLDELVAWDGDPAKLTNDMKDCFDFYQDNPGFFVRSIVEYMMVGQAMSGLFKGLRDTGASYGISVFKDSAPNVADSEGYVYEFELTRTVEQLLALNLGALDLSNPAGSDKDVELYGKALSQHLKNLRGDGKLDAYNYVFENVCADLEAKKMNVAGGLGQVFAGINAVAAAQGIPTNFNVDGYYQVLTGRTDATVNGETVADFTAMFYADYTANGENKLVKFSEYLDVFAAVAMQVPDVITGLKKAADGYAEIMQGINVIIPEAKAAFTEKLQGIYDSYHNTLDYTYDILATIVQYLAKINTITMGEEMNLSNTNALATFITNSFMNGAQSKFYYELEKNGVQATGAPEVPEFVITDDMIAQAGLNDPATIAIGVFAVRYDIGNSFFAHPNEKGHAQITEAIFKALTEGSDAEDFSNTKILLYTQILKNRYPNLYAIVTGANQVGELDDLAIIFAMLKLVNNPAINMMDLDELQAQIRDANRDYAASKTPEEQAKAQAIVSELLKRLYQMVTYVTGTVYKPTADSYYVSLGDSTITGYGFDGYEDNQKNGWGQNVEGSAHLLLAQKYFGDNWENQFANYCQGALRADDLLYFLGGDVAIDDYYKHEIEESLPFGTIEETQKQFVATVKKADLISVAIGGGNVLTFVGKQMNRVMNGQEALKLDWSKIGINEDEASMKELNEALDLLVPIVDELGLLDQYVPAEMKPLKNPAKLTRALAESLLYGYASYNYYYPLVLERIKEINPDAQLMIIGMFNPVDDWSMTTEINGEATVINIGGATGNLIATANLQSLAFALQHEKTTFVDISDAETHLEADNPGKKLEFSDYFGGALRLNGKGVHASEEGHEYIVKQMSDALNGGIEGALLDTYNYVMNLVNKVDAILNNNLSGVITDLQGDLTVLCGELNTKFNVLNAQLQKLTDAERAILNEMLAERDVLVEQLEDQKAQLEMLFSGQQARTYSLNRTSNSAEALIAETQSKIAETEAAIAALDSSIAALNAKIAADLENVDVIRSSISAIQAKINALLAVLADAIPAVKKLNTDLKKLYDASMVLAAAIDNVNDLTFDKIDVQAVVNAINTIYSLMPTIIEQTEDVYNKTQTAYENAKLAATSLKVTIDTIETAMNDIVDGMEVVAGIEATKLAAIQVAVAQCQEAVKSFVNDNYGAVETALLNSHNQLKDLAYGEIAKAQNVLAENKTLILAVVSGAVLALQKAGFIEVENGQVALTPDYQKLVVDYIQSLNDKLAELRERVETSKQWLNNNYPTARTELNNKLKALCEKLSKLETQMREELDIQKQEVLKIECEQLKKLIAEVTAKQTKLEVYAQEVLDYIATVEAAIADVQTALNDVIAAGAVVGSDIEALWNKLMALTPVLDELAKTVNGLSYKILNELYEIFEYCGIIADNFVAVLKTLPAYVDILRNAVNLTIDTWNVLVKTTRQTINNILNAMCEKLEAVKKNAQGEALSVIAKIEGLLNNLKALLEQKAEGLSQEVLEKIYAAIEQVEKALDALKDIVNGQYDSVYEMIKALAKAEADLRDALNNLIKVLNAEAKDIYDQMVDQFNAVMAMVNNLIENREELIENLGKWLLDELVKALPVIDQKLYAFFYNSPEKVIAFVDNYGYLVAENPEAIVAVLGYITVTFGPDALEWVLNNPQKALTQFIAWYEIYGDRTWAMIDVYLEALGINDQINDTIGKIMNAATEIQKNIVNKHNNLILEMHNTLNALIEIIENELKTATGEAKTTLQNMLKAAIALKVGLVELVQGNIYSAIAKIQSAYNSLVAALNSGAQHLNATIRNQLMILVNYLRQSVIELVKDFGEAVKNIVGDYYNALIQEVADVLTNVDAWFVDWMHNHPAYVLAWLNAQGENFLNFLEENIDEIIYNACHGEYTVTDNSYYAAITGNGNGYVGLLANALWLNSAQYGSMTWDNLDYLSLMKADLITLGYDESTLNAFAVEQLLGYVNAYVDVELRGSAKAYANGIANSLLTEIPFLKPEAFAGVAGGVDTAIDGLLAHELLENRQMKELDWAALVGEENLGYVDQVMDELEAQMIKNGIPEYYEIEIDVVDFLFENAAAMGIEYVLNMLEPEALKVTLGEYAIYTIQIPVREALLFAAESYLYGNLEFQKKYDEIMLLLYAFNPNATVILLGNYNAFRQVDLTIGDVSVELSEAYKSIVKISSVHSFAYAVAMPNVIYVDIPDVQTNYEYYVAAGYIENSVENFLGAYISDITTTQASPIGNEYIKNQILAALTVTCEHKYTDVCVDSVCTRCGVIREDVAHSFTNYISDNNATCTEDGTKTAKCDRCDATNTIVDIGSALQHDWSDWYTVKEPTNDEVGEERRDCLNDGCEHYETREIPKIVKVDPEYTVPSDLTAKYGDTLADIALPEGFTWKDATASVGNAGVNTFIAIYTPEDTIHYNVVEIEVTIMVEKSNASVTNAPSAMGTLIANGTAQTLVQAGTATGGTMVYSLSENGPFTETLPTATNAGVYTVYYKVKGDTNHNDTQVQSLTITVYPDKITSDEHLVDEGTYIRKVKAGLTVEQFWNNINENAYVTIFDKDGNVVDSNALVATGMVAKLIVNGEVVDSVTVIVTGDVNGDGKITITDMCAVQHHVLETNLITGVYLLAADTQNDGKVTMTDFVQIQHHVLEISQIVEN